MLDGEIAEELHQIFEENVGSIEVFFNFLRTFLTWNFYL